jgi:tRNA-Thr(GGU) m(6)t(6)A37 methyltransferase TsaA
MSETRYTIEAIGEIRSELDNLANAPLQGDEGTYEAWLELHPEFKPGLDGIQPGDELLVLTWLHLAQRELLQIRPRGRQDAPLTGVFATRSPHRPNPIGLHRVSVLEIDGLRLRVAPIEAINGTPIIDIKPVIGAINER